jgi:hypothetical protein
MRYTYHISWKTVIQQVRTLPSGRDLEVAKDAVVHPRDAGFERHVGLPFGTFGDFRRATADGGCIHVREETDRYLVHWDKVDPRRDLIEHGRQDAPHLYLGAAAAIGALIGKHSGKGALACASIVAFIALLTLPKREAA